MKVALVWLEVGNLWLLQVGIDHAFSMFMLLEAGALLQPKGILGVILRWLEPGLCASSRNVHVRALIVRLLLEMGNASVHGCVS